MRPNLLETFIS